MTRRQARRLVTLWAGSLLASIEWPTTLSPKDAALIYDEQQRLATALLGRYGVSEAYFDPKDILREIQPASEQQELQP